MQICSVSRRKPSCPNSELMVLNCAPGIHCAHWLPSWGGKRPSEVMEMTRDFALMRERAFCTPPRARPRLWLSS